MDFRVTVGLGQDSADPAVLDERAAALQRCIPAGTALVDVVKAAIQLVLPLTADDGLEAVRQGIGIVEQAVRDAALSRPTSIVVVEAEAVTTGVSAENLSPHQPS